MTIYRIAKWDTIFERSESRKLKQLSWIAMPVGFNSTGYQAMIEEFGDDAPGIYGAWCSLVAFAATCHVRGILGNSRGIPLKLSHVARITGFPVAIFERLVAWASRADIGWLEPVSSDELSRVLEKNLENDCKCEVSGDSPDEPPASRGNPPYTLPNRTEHNITEPDITRQHRTEPNRTEHERVRSSVDWSARWSLSNLKKSFVDDVLDTARRFTKLRQPLDRTFVWQVSWIGCEFDRDAVNDACDRCKIPGEVKRPKQYIGSIMMKLCERNGEDWDALKKLVPEPPPPPKHDSVQSAIEATQ